MDFISLDGIELNVVTTNGNSFIYADHNFDVVEVDHNDFISI